MGTPRSFFDGENQAAMVVMHDYLKGREPHQEDADVIDGMFMALASAGLVVVKKDEWDMASALANAITAYR